MKTVFSALTALRTFLVDVLVIGSVSGIALFIYLELSRDTIIIDEIGLPKPLLDMGYTGQIASVRLWDALQRINDETALRTDFDEQTPWLTESEQIKFTEPQTGISLQGVVQLLGRLDGSSRRIAGDFVCGDPECTPDKIELRLECSRMVGSTGSLEGQRPRIAPLTDTFRMSL